MKKNTPVMPEICNTLSRMDNLVPFFPYLARYIGIARATVVGDDGSVWTARLRGDYKGGYEWPNNVVRYISSTWSVTKDLEPCMVSLNKEQAISILAKKNPYAAQLAYDGIFEAEELLLAPQLEQLYKAGYAFANTSEVRLHWGQFKRLTKPGSRMKDIFKCSRTVYNALKNEPDLTKWESIRKMEKFGRITKEDAEFIAANRYDVKDLGHLESIMRAQYDGKQVFTMPTLAGYLDRLDMFQAIGKEEALTILDDYLKMCHSLGVKPNIDSDSLKREHDVSARILRNKRNEILNERMKSGCKYLEEYNYQEHTFMIRGIRDYDDLLDEAKQQHNCVAGYADGILSKRNRIYVMRETKAPDKSLATIELIRDTNNKFRIRQKFLAYNQPIRNRAMTEFLDRWVRKVNSGELTAKEVPKFAVEENEQLALVC